MRRRNDRQSLIEGVFMALALAVFVVGAVFLRTSVPCSVLGWLPAAEIPARCLMESHP